MDDFSHSEEKISEILDDVTRSKRLRFTVSPRAISRGFFGGEFVPKYLEDDKNEKTSGAGREVTATLQHQQHDGMTPKSR